MSWLNDQIHLRWQENIQEERAQNTKFDSILINALILSVQCQLTITHFYKTASPFFSNIKTKEIH